jgi:hypothetical protein
MKLLSHECNLPGVGAGPGETLPIQVHFLPGTHTPIQSRYQVLHIRALLKANPVEPRDDQVVTWQLCFGACAGHARARHGRAHVRSASCHETHRAMPFGVDAAENEVRSGVRCDCCVLVASFECRGRQPRPPSHGSPGAPCEQQVIMTSVPVAYGECRQENGFYVVRAKVSGHSVACARHCCGGCVLV